MSENLKDNIQWLRDTIDLTEKQQKLVDFLANWAKVDDINYFRMLNLVELLEPVLQDADKLLRHQATCAERLLAVRTHVLVGNLKRVLSEVRSLRVDSAEVWDVTHKPALELMLEGAIADDHKFGLEVARHVGQRK